MRVLLILLVLAAGAWWAYTQWMPEIEQRKTAAKEAKAEAEAAGSCVAAATAASRSAVDEMEAFTRQGVDRALWSAVLMDAAGQLTEADGACGCSGEACWKASQALRETRQLLTDLDRAVRGGLPTPDGFAARQIYVERLLREARGLAGAG